MSEVFNFRRFGRYAARNYVLNWKKYLVQFGLLLGFMMLALLIVRALNHAPLGSGDVHDLHGFYFNFVLSASAVIFVISMMRPFKSRHTLAIENTVPASTTEKFLFIFMNMTVVFFALFLLAVFVTALLGIIIGNTDVSIRDFFYNENGMTWHYIFWLYLPLQAGALYAGTMERQNHLVSLLSVVAVSVAVLVALVSPAIMSAHYDMALSYGPMFSFFSGVVSLEHVRIYYSDVVYYFNNISFTSGLALVGTLMFWIAAWFNFRERSVK